MSELTLTGFRDALSSLDAGTARRLARQFDQDSDELKRRAQALLAYADVLEERGDAEGPGKQRVALTRSDIRRGSPANKPPLILALLQERPRPGWPAHAVRSTLLDRGLIPPETTEASISAAMRRMLRKEQIGKLPDGSYTTREAALSDDEWPLPAD